MSNVKPINRGSLASYTIGFVLSVGLTLASYIFVQYYAMPGQEMYSKEGISIAIMVFAITQLVVQLLFFLHLGTEARPKWNIVTFLFMLLVVLIVGIGSIWIMHNLDYNMMGEHDMNQHMMKESEKGF